MQRLFPEGLSCHIHYAFLPLFPPSFLRLFVSLYVCSSVDSVCAWELYLSGCDWLDKVFGEI